jgi:type IV secretory pathway TraG/TraD family ATPase VirD4
MATVYRISSGEDERLFSPMFGTSLFLAFHFILGAMAITLVMAISCFILYILCSILSICCKDDKLKREEDCFGNVTWKGKANGYKVKISEKKGLFGTTYKGTYGGEKITLKKGFFGNSYSGTTKSGKQLKVNVTN